MSLITQRETTETARGHLWALECDLKMSSGQRLDEGLWKESFHVTRGQADSSQGRLCDWYRRKVPHRVRLLIPTVDKA